MLACGRGIEPANVNYAKRTNVGKRGANFGGTLKRLLLLEERVFFFKGGREKNSFVVETSDRKRQRTGKDLSENDEGKS